MDDIWQIIHAIRNNLAAASRHLPDDALNAILVVYVGCESMYCCLYSALTSFFLLIELHTEGAGIMGPVQEFYP